MGHLNLKPSFILVGVLILTGCKDENGNFSVGVSLGGTGTGAGGVSVGTESPVPKPQSDVKPDRMEEDAEYAVAYPNPITQNCGGVERTIQFVRHYAPFPPMVMGDRMDLLSIHNDLRVRYKIQVVVKNKTSAPIYEYINSCEAAFQLTGSKTSKKTQTDYCLNDETVNTYQPNESRTYYYSFNLPNILQNWTASYQAQYAKQLYPTNYDDENVSTRTQCAALSTILLLDEYPSTRDGAPPSSNHGAENGSDSGQTETASSEPPIFGGFDLGEETDTESPLFGGFGLGDEL
ncbi:MULTISPECIES: hypothetical protein [Acinetobacter]|uniref:hypothetical protein n=1 Tax=Acinetobacter TaxID=469 RepID=UPI00051C61B3|nr:MULTISPECIES: hypothetical protein [Acinetobacter]MCH7382047.1 hypothetical protein [Acinetobacter higginsii]